MQESPGRGCALPPPHTQETHLPFRIILGVQLASLGSSTEFWETDGNGSGAGRGKVSAGIGGILCFRASFSVLSC